MAKGKYETHVKDKLMLVEAWARDGLTDEQIYKKLGIGRESFYKYKREHSEFSESLKKGKEIVDVQVENALLKKALGYDYEESFEFVKESEKGTEKISRRTTKHSPADTTAIIFWLKNRKPNEWRDKREFEANAHDKLENILNKLDESLGSD